MNYQILKNIIENLLQSFECPSCSSEISEQNLEIVWAAWSSINVNVNCWSCNKSTLIRTEVATINLWKIDGLKIPDEIKSKIQNLKSEIAPVKKTFINDEEIISLNKKLKNISWVEDLFSKN